MFIQIGGALLAVITVAAIGLWVFAERWRLIRPSTIALAREAGLRRFLNLEALHGYVYGRWTNQYLNVLLNYVMPRMGPRAKKWLSDRYHGKVLTHEQAKAIITLDCDISRRDLEQIIPYPLARDLVLHGPPDVAAYECGCRHARANPCQPTQVCMVVGQPFVDFILEHNPHSSRRLTKAEAEELLQAEHERGHLHSAWFKDALLDRFYAICNCCKCCCGGIRAMTEHGIPMVASSGYVAQVSEGTCVGCGTCEKICPFRAARVADGTSTVNWEACMGCGVCEGQCPNNAIALVRDERKGVPFDVRLLRTEPQKQVAA